MNKAKQAGMELPIESVVADRYQIVRLLARGGMAEVYVARHIKLNREIALKLLKPPPDAEDPGSFVDRFRLEAETLAGLDHNNIVILHDFGETDDGRFFLAMEFVDGPRLTDLLKSGPLPYERAIRLLLQVCNALRYAHKRGVVHRDLKPSNLLIRLANEDQEEQIKVVDFGLVKLAEADQSITRAGLILGSPHCMAPEQVKGTDIDNRADIYAVGVLLFRSIMGSYPFHGSNSTATMIAHLNQPTPSFHSVAPHITVPNGLENIVRKCLAKNPDERHPDMDALMWDLASCINLPPDQYGSLSFTSSTIQRSVAPVRKGPSALLGLLIAGGAFAVVMFGAALLGTGLIYATSDGGVSGPEDVVIKPATPEIESKVAADDPRAPESDKPDVDEPKADPAEGTAAAPEAAPPPIKKPPVAAVKAPTKSPPPVKKAPPVPAPSGDAEADKPAPEADTPDPTEEDTKDTPPDGYMGLPDDLF